LGNNPKNKSVTQKKVYKGKKEKRIGANHRNISSCPYDGHKGRVETLKKRGFSTASGDH